jgi:hypothetical protein
LQSQLFTHAYLIEDAHAHESSVLDRVLADLASGHLVLADRHFCIVYFLWKMNHLGVAFVIRQHGRLKGELIGKRKRLGHSSHGVVYEQKLRIGDGEQSLIVRRITVELIEPTRDGDPPSEQCACEGRDRDSTGQSVSSTVGNRKGLPRFDHDTDLRIEIVRSTTGGVVSILHGDAGV